MKSFNKYSKISLVGFFLVALGVFGYFTFLSLQRPYLTVIGPVKMGDGIGRQAVELINALHNEMKMGFIPTQKVCLTDVPLKIHSLLEPNKHLGRIIVYEEPLPIPDQKMNKRLNKTLRGPKRADQLRIAYSMYEYSSIPSEWAEALNTYFDAVAVPDEFLVKAYQDSGVKIPIFILPLGLEIDAFLQQPIKTSPNKPFCFINTSSMIPRKNHEGLIQAFYQAFGDSPDVQLVLNYRYAAGDALEKVTKLIQSLNAKNILLNNATLNNSQYLQLLSKGDVFVTLTKGEGFSIQPREAMALGVPIIITDNTAHKTIIKSGLACAVSCPATEVSYNPFLKCDSMGYLSDIDEAAQALRTVYENYEKYLESSAERRQWAAKYRFENLKPFYLSLVKPSKVILGDKNEIAEDSITTSSIELYAKYKKLCKLQ